MHSRIVLLSFGEVAYFVWPIILNVCVILLSLTVEYSSPFVCRVAAAYIHVSAAGESSFVCVLVLNAIYDSDLSHVALLFYDIFLTVDREARHIWTRRHATTTTMYIVARYSSILTHLAVLLIGTRWSGQSI